MYELSFIATCCSLTTHLNPSLTPRIRSSCLVPKTLPPIQLIRIKEGHRNKACSWAAKGVVPKKRRDISLLHWRGPIRGPGVRCPAHIGSRATGAVTEVVPVLCHTGVRRCPTGNPCAILLGHSLTLYPHCADPGLSLKSIGSSEPAPGRARDSGDEPAVPGPSNVSLQ